MRGWCCSSCEGSWILLSRVMGMQQVAAGTGTAALQAVQHGLPFAQAACCADTLLQCTVLRRLLKTKASTVQSLYASTAKLLSYTANAAESALGNDLSKDALRILTERLCAMCHMREAVHTQGRFAEAAAKAQQLSSRFNHSHQSLASLDGSSHAAGTHDSGHGGGTQQHWQQQGPRGICQRQMSGVMVVVMLLHLSHPGALLVG